MCINKATRFNSHLVVFIISKQARTSIEQQKGLITQQQSDVYKNYGQIKGNPR